ncbi:MAG: hypothetical protein LKG25_08425 [Prevotella sp.]|jgi:hypothetical protein|nr:hypothetical protein [Prevotella sp.]
MQHYDLQQHKSVKEVFFKPLEPIVVCLMSLLLFAVEVVSFCSAYYGWSTVAHLEGWLWFCGLAGAFFGLLLMLSLYTLLRYVILRFPVYTFMEDRLICAGFLREYEWEWAEVESVCEIRLRGVFPCLEMKIKNKRRLRLLQLTNLTMPKQALIAFFWENIQRANSKG